MPNPGCRIRRTPGVRLSQIRLCGLTGLLDNRHPNGANGLFKFLGRPKLSHPSKRASRAGRVVKAMDAGPSNRTTSQQACTCDANDIVHASADARSLAIGSDPGRRRFPACYPAIERQFLKCVQRKPEQLPKGKHVTTDSYPGKCCSEQDKHKAQ